MKPKERRKDLPDKRPKKRQDYQMRPSSNFREKEMLK